MLDLRTLSWVLWFFNTILIKTNSAHDKEFLFYFTYFLVPTIPDGSVPTVPEGNGGDGDDDDDRWWLNKIENKASTVIL